MSDAVTKLELRACDGRVLDSLTFPDPLPFGEIYDGGIELANPIDSGTPGRAYAMCLHRKDAVDDDHVVQPGESLSYSVFRVVAND